MKKMYSKPNMTFVTLSANEAIATSGGTGGGTCNWTGTGTQSNAINVWNCWSNHASNGDYNIQAD